MPGSQPRLQRDSWAGFSLVEAIVSLGLCVTMLIGLAQLFTMSTRANVWSRRTSYATVLAQQKIEQLRALTLGFDVDGMPVSDVSSNTAVSPDRPAGGTGLSPSPDGSLRQNMSGYVDYVDALGGQLPGGEQTPVGAVYTRRWSVEPLPDDPENAVIIQVVVTRSNPLGGNGAGSAVRSQNEAHLVTVKRRHGA